MDQFKTIRDRLNLKDKLDVLFGANQQKLKSFVPKVSFAIEKNHFVIKTVDTPEELERVLRLRHDIFYGEYLNKKLLAGLDFDRFDLLCDHLVVIDKRQDQILGTYRVNCTLFTDQFYTASEFNIDRLMELKGVKLELGRACIDKEHRNGILIHLLWRAIAHYIKMTGADYLFGCASVWSTSQLEISSVYKYLHDHNHLSSEPLVRPINDFFDPVIGEYFEFLNRPEFNFNSEPAQKQLPALLKSYLKLGAKVCGEPGFDRFFRCYDFVTLQKIKALDVTIERKYGLC